MLEGEIKINSKEQLDFLIDYLIEERNEVIEVPDDYSAKRDLFRALMNVRMPREVSDEFLKQYSAHLKSPDLRLKVLKPYFHCRLVELLLQVYLIAL